MNQKRVGVILSYANLALGMVVNIFLTPFLIRMLGDVDYSVYKVMQSFSGPLAMFHLGISTIVTRSIVKYQTTENASKEEKENTFALSVIASGIMAVIVMIAGAVMLILISKIYGNTFTVESLTAARKVFIIFVISAVLHILTDAFSGCLIGHEKFAISSGLTLSKTALKLILVFVLLKLGAGVIAVVLVELIIAAMIFIFSLCYSMSVLNERPKLSYFDKKQILEILSFGLAIFLQAFVNQVNNNADTMILGAYIEEKRIITMYSSALAIYSIYNSLISAITFLFLPKATRLVNKNASGKELTDFVVKPGRFQAVIAVACICGFALFGQNFINIWIGEKYHEAYWIILMLIIPVTVPLVENAAISILDATLKRIYRSVVLVIMAVINIIISIILIKPLGFWGAAIGTVLSLVIGHIILMNYYYAREFKMEIGRMFLSIFKGILPSGLLASVLCVPVVLFLDNTLFLFIIKCCLFIVVYALLLWIFGLNDYEKDIVIQTIKKLFNNKSMNAN